MKLRTVGLLALVLLLFGGAAWWQFQSRTTPPTQALGPLFPDLDPGKVARLEIRDGDGTLRIRRSDSGKWEIETFMDFPARFDTIRNLVTRIRDMKSVRSFTADADALKRLVIRSPESRPAPGRQIRLQDASGSDLVSVIIGKPREAGKGQYVRLPESDRVWMVDQTFMDTDPAPDSWIETHLLKVPAQVIKEIELRDADRLPVWKLVRNVEDGRFVPHPPLPEGAILDRDAIQAAQDALQNLAIETVVARHDPLNPPKTPVPHILYTTMDDVQIGLWPEPASEGATKRTVRFTVHAQGEWLDENGRFPEKPENTGTLAPNRLVRTLGWAVTLPPHTIEAFQLGRKDFRMAETPSP